MPERLVEIENSSLENSPARKIKKLKQNVVVPVNNTLKHELKEDSKREIQK